MGIQQPYINTTQAIKADADIEALLKETERSEENIYCLDFEVEGTDIDPILFYEEVTCKKKCYINA